MGLKAEGHQEVPLTKVKARHTVLHTPLPKIWSVLLSFGLKIKDHYKLLFPAGLRFPIRTSTQVKHNDSETWLLL